MNNWQKIISNFLRHIPYSEKEYQERIVSILVSIGLGWEDESINQQLSLNLGSTKRVVPDIVLSKNGRPVIIIEVKPNHHRQQERDILQLTSYMKQLEINIGIYFGEKVEVYYKELGANNSPIKLLELQLIANDSKWEQFVAMFSNGLFNIENIKVLYKEALKLEEENLKVSKLTSELISPCGVQLVEDAIRNHFLRLGVELPLINKVIAKLNIQIRPQVETPPISSSVFQNNIPVQTKNCQGRATFSINGEGEYGVGKLALAIVTMVSANHPDLSYEDLTRIFNTWRDNIKTIDEINIWKSLTRDKSKNTRWFEKYPIKSNDGVLFAVSTQWGIFNIDNMIKQGTEHGLIIERIR